MRIAYVTRSHENAGLQGKLNGGFSIAKYLERLFGAQHVQIPGTAFPGEGVLPELNDLRNYGSLAEIDWSLFDRILFGEYAFAPFFDLAQIEAAMLVHSMWVWKDAGDPTAEYLEKFLPFVQHAICPTMESFGLFKAKGIDASWLPYPVPDDYFVPSELYAWSERPIDVIWVGRDGVHKDPQMLLEIALMLPHLSFVAYSSTPLVSIMGHTPKNLEVRVRRPRDECHGSMGKAKVLLMTSHFETYATCLIEGGLSGCAVATREAWGTRHTVPGATLFDRAWEGVEVIKKLLDSGPTMPRSFWVQKFGASALEPRWRAFLEVWF